MQVLLFILIGLLLDALYFHAVLIFMRWFWVIALVITVLFLYMAALNVYTYPNGAHP